MFLRVPIHAPEGKPVLLHKVPTVGSREETEEMAEKSEGYLRVPVWLVVILISIAGGLVLNGAATVYWAADFKRAFNDFEEKIYKQKIDQLEDQILELKNDLKDERRQHRDDISLLTERQNDTRNRLAQRGIFSK